MGLENTLESRSASFTGHKSYLKQASKTGPVVYCLQAVYGGDNALLWEWFTMTYTPR